jgi:hypothetical protein
MPALPEPVFHRLVPLPGEKTWAVFWIIWQRSKIERSKTITLTSVRLRQSGINRHHKRRALDVLKRAKLIRVKRQRRKNPVVTLLV